MNNLNKGNPAPEFCLKDMDEKSVCLSDFSGNFVVLYFYPKDNTKVCTMEAREFTGEEQHFASLNTRVIGISPDNPKSHKKFIDKQELRVLLLSDPEHEVMEKYGVWKMKKMYGKEYMGVERSTFIIDPE